MCESKKERKRVRRYLQSVGQSLCLDAVEHLLLLELFDNSCIIVLQYSTIRRSNGKYSMSIVERKVKQLR